MTGNVLEEVCQRLEHARDLTGQLRPPGPPGRPRQIFTTSQLEAGARVVEFMRSCRVVRLTFHVEEMYGADGKEPNSYFKCKLWGRMRGKPTVRTLLLRTGPLPDLMDLMGQLFHREGRFYHPPVALLKDLVPQDQWDALEKRIIELKTQFDSSAAQKRIQEIHDKIFQTEREKLTVEMAQLQRRGWKLSDILECWNEALVKGVMEA